MDLHLAEAIKAILGTYPQVRKRYYDDVFVAVYDYLDSEQGITKFKNSMKTAIGNAFVQAAEIAWEAGGGALLIDPAIADWVASMTDAEFAFVDVLFQNLKAIRGSEDLKLFEYSSARASGYAGTLDKIYNYVKVAAAKDVMLTFAGDDGAESCSDCTKYKGKRHKASWWVKNNAVPPNRDFECKGYNCQHALVDDSGKVWTL
jgi:hypothetical protein